MDKYKDRDRDRETFNNILYPREIMPSGDGFSGKGNMPHYS